ncbi:hypothetical protein [Kordia zhangzhouensis]|uniref:hypothetical protein n=1 Tax=Kordia zhangzhouensis TaxID=1620405 RepID=UPI0006299DD3|nr:hypothetical protein [Kordia zhangzhouensis]
MRALFFALTGIILVGCASSRIRPKLPSSLSCDENAKIYDIDTKFDTNSLTNLSRLSYTATYTMIHTLTDSLEKDSIRFSINKTAKKVVKKVFPESTFLDETLLLHKKYNDIMFYTTDIRLNNEDQKAVSKLTIPNLNSSKQLFVEVRTYVKDGSFSNTIRLYVFDLRAKKLLYYDSVKYKCDPRDEIMFMKTLYYGMNKLKNSIN